MLKNGNIYHIPILETSINDLEELRTAIQTNSDRIYFATILITVNAKTLEELDLKSIELQEEFARNSSQIRSLDFRQLDAFKSALPVNNNQILNVEKNITSGGLSSFFPISNPDLTHTEGVYLRKKFIHRSSCVLEFFYWSTHAK